MKISNGKLWEKIGKMEEAISDLKKEVEKIRNNELPHISNRIVRIEKVIWAAIGAFALLEFLIRYFK